jgi:hypothetical protein
MGIIAALFGRKALAQRSVRSVGEDGFADLDLPLTDFSKDPSGEFRLTARGDFDGRVVGLSVVVGATWKPQENSGFTAYWGTVTLRAIGDASDAFVDLLAKLYGTSISTRRMLPEVVTQAVGLATDPRELMSEPAKMKLFFHTDVEDRYAEVFLNIDRSEKLVQFHEKDPEYRGNVLRALTEAA